ncbi:MAG: GNAT family N-acetyltransferase [Calditrichaeota bacterium]|nr:MAG: GNAT family N-acetyltransferase [Calditrichota bacterium]
MKSDNTYPNIEIQLLEPGATPELVTMFNSADSKYSKYFIPFNFEYKSVKTMLSQAVLDKYFGFYFKGTLIGFFMLRGLDAGYQIPSYGVWINPKYQRCGLGKLSLTYCLALCNINNFPALMLKVHPENIKAIHLYINTGFEKISMDKSNQNIIMQKKIKTSDL